MKSGTRKAEHRNLWGAHFAVGHFLYALKYRRGEGETRRRGENCVTRLVFPLGRRHVSQRTSAFRIPNGDARRRPSAFGFPASVFGIPLSAFRFGLALALLCVTYADEGAAATIRLAESAEVGTSIVTLGDVAEVTDRDADTAARLQEIMLAPAPGTGRPLRLDFATIRSRLLAQGVNLVDVEFSGKSVVTVTAAATKTVAPPRLLPQSISRPAKQAEKLVARAVTQYLERHVPELGEVELSPRIEPQDVPRILSGAGSGCQIVGGSPPWDGPQKFVLRFRDREQLRSYEVGVPCLVKRLPQVVTVKYTVPAGHVLRPDDIELQQVESAAGALTRPDEVIGKQTNRPIRRGQQIRSPDVRAIPLVDSGDVVTVYARRPGITVKRQMKAREDGARGETVTLVSLDGRKKLLATVTGYREAEVLGSGGSPRDVLQDATGRIRFQAKQAKR